MAPPPSQDIDVETADIDNTEPATPPEESNQTSSTDIDIPMPGPKSNDPYDRHPRPTLEEAPEFVAHPSSSHVPVVFDSDSDSDSDDDADRDQAPLHLGAETAPSSGGLLDTETEQTSRAHEGQLSEVLSNPDPVQFVVKFPGAGEALEAQPSLVGYHRYASSLGNEENELSEWAPFSTRLEWEVACWAKLRGPSSTALSELLRIDGVSEPIFIPPTLTGYRFSAVRITWFVILKLG